MCSLWGAECELHGQPALCLEIGALRTGPVATRVIPDAGHMAIGTRLHMAPQRGRPALDDRAGGAADMGGQRMGLLVGGKRVLKNSLEGDRAHRPRSGVRGLSARVPRG